MNHGQHCAAYGLAVTFVFGLLFCDPIQACIAGAIVAVAALFCGLDAEREGGGM